MRVEFPAVAGRPYSGTLALSNSATVKVRVRVELLDFYVDDSMTPQFVKSAPAEAEFSCRQWLSVNPMELELEPQSQVNARFTVHVPASALERSFHCAIGFVTLPALTEQSETGILTAVRMVATLYPMVGKPPVSGQIKDLKLEPVSNDPAMPWRAVVIMENSGLTLYRPAGDLDVLDATGQVVESEKLASFPALPKRQQRYLVPLKTPLSPGRYTLRARIEVGNEIQEGSAAITVDPPSPAAPAPETPPAVAAPEVRPAAATAGAPPK
jgi:hypothetical protein